jgi:hypothetical protein
MAPHRVWLITAVGPPPWAITIDGMVPPWGMSCSAARGLRERIEAKIGRSRNRLFGPWWRKDIGIYAFLTVLKNAPGN